MILGKWGMEKDEDTVSFSDLLFYKASRGDEVQQGMRCRSQLQNILSKARGH